jgi:hypothetical protein
MNPRWAAAAVLLALALQRSRHHHGARTGNRAAILLLSTLALNRALRRV